MFGKNILSLISILFIGNQIVSMVNAETPVCRVKLTDSGSGIDDCELGTAESGEEIACENGYYAMFSQAADGNDKVNDKTQTGDGILIQLSGTAGSSCDIVNEGVGYYISGDGQYISRKGDGTVDILETVSADSCAAGKLTNDGKICIDADESHVVTPVNGNDYLITNVYQIFSSTASESVAAKFETGKGLLLDTEINGSDYCVDAETKLIQERGKEFCDGASSDNCENYYTCANGQNCSDTTNPSARGGQGGGACDPKDSLTVANCNGYYLDGTDIYECDTSTCDKKTELIGYFINAGESDHYIKCSATGETADVNDVTLVKNTCIDVDINNDLEDDCTDTGAGFGALIKDLEGVKFCKDGNAGVAVSTAAQYFIDANDASTPFVYSQQGDSTTVLVNINSGNVILSTKDGNYIEKTSGDALQSTLDGSGSLYVCTLTNGVSVCKADTKTLGYLVNAGDSDTPTVPYIKCERNVSVNSCTAIDSITSTTDCSKAGDIVKVDTDYKICMFPDTDTMDDGSSTGLVKAAITGSTSTHFFVDASATDPIFVKQSAATGYFVMVDVLKGNIILNQDATPKKYRYVIGSQVYLKGESTETTCGATTTEDTVVEYVRETADGDNTGYYTKST